jgi:BirA family transcriptional regulator, biotin operon repressor / biotin---[acetyl-CoA-carboxylase] ligase
LIENGLWEKKARNFYLRGPFKLALFTAAQATWPFLNWSLKAPNDLFVEDKKIAGLLLETVSQGSEFRMIIGLGMNIFSNPEDIPTATHLLENLSPETPLLGEDWVLFLERLFFEFSSLVPWITEPLNSTQNARLIYALNKNPILKNKILSATEMNEELWR